MLEKFTHRQRHETKKSLGGLSILLARGEQHTNLLSAASQEFSTAWSPPVAFYLVTHTHTYNLLFAFMCPDLVFLLSLQSSPYLGSVKIIISGETTFLLKITALFVSPLLLGKF